MTNQDNQEVSVVEELSTTSVRKAKKLMRSRFGLSIMALISFVESALPLPILTDPFLAAAILLHRTQAVKIVMVTTIASTVGGVAAYYMAAYFFETLVAVLQVDALNEFNMLLENGGESSVLLLTLVGAITPIPYTAVAWVLAVLEGSIMIFIVGSVIGRGFRYAVVGYCTYRFGPLAITYAKRYVGITSLVLIILVAVFFLLKM